MNEKKGILYGVGVGPGDPELITMKAVRVLNGADVVFAAASTKNTDSLALRIAKPHIPDTIPVRLLHFPMTREKSETLKAWKNHAGTIIDELTKGKRVVFITLGDSMTYSTYGYILKHVLKMAPRFPVVSIPGITSYQAAAACVNMPLVEGEASLLLNSGADGGERLRRFKEKPESVVFLKAYRNVEDITRAIHEAGVYDTSVGVSNCGQKDEQVIRNIDELCDQRPNYWTLILAKNNKQDGS